MSVALFAFWTSTEAHHNPYTNDVIDAMTKWNTAEAENLPEPLKSRMLDIVNDAQSRKWSSLGPYLTHMRNELSMFFLDILRTKREVSYGNEDYNVFEKVQKIRNSLSGF